MRALPTCLLALRLALALPGLAAASTPTDAVLTAASVDDDGSADATASVDVERSTDVEGSADATDATASMDDDGSTDATDASAEAEKPRKKRPPFGLGGWAHFGGGAGALIGTRKVHPVGRVDIGFGGNLFLIYGGIAANVSFSSHMDLVVTGVGYAGLTIPIPLVRPMLGSKFGGGLHQDAEYGPSPALQLGPQIGMHIGQIAGTRFGIRVMVDAEATVSIDHRIAGFSIIGTLALML